MIFIGITLRVIITTAIDKDGDNSNSHGYDDDDNTLSNYDNNITKIQKKRKKRKS